MSADCEGMGSIQKNLACSHLCFFGTLWVFGALLVSYYERLIMKIGFCSNRSQFVQSVLAQCVVELSSARSTFRFTIQGHDDKVYILVRSDFCPVFCSLLVQGLRSSLGFVILNSQV